MTTGSLFTPVFSSYLAPIFVRYVDLKRSLGRCFDSPARTLQSLDWFLDKQKAKYSNLNAAAFQAWCHTHEHVASGVRRVRMLDVYNFCLYRRRTELQCFVPDPGSFPSYHQRLKPYIFSEADVAKLLRACSGLQRDPVSPVRPEVIRLAIVLLFTTGIRRGELLHLTIGDYDRRESTLHIRETKFLSHASFQSIAALPTRSITMCVPGASESFPSPRVSPSSGMPTMVDGLTAARVCGARCGFCSKNVPSRLPRGASRESMIFVMPSP